MRAGSSIAFFLSIAAVSIAAGCDSEVPLGLNLGQGQVAIYATTDGSGAILGVGKIERNAPIRVAAPRDALLFTWTLNESQLIGPDGEALTEAELDKLEIQTDRVGGCGRCLAVGEGGAQLLQTGDSCPIPRFAEAGVFAVGKDLEPTVVSAELSAVVRTKVRLAMPGECACDARLPDGAGVAGVEVCPLLPLDMPWHVGSVAMALDEAGWFGMFYKQVGTILAPDGRRWDINDEYPLIGSPGPVIPLATSSVTEGGRFLVFSPGLLPDDVDERADVFEVVDDRIVHRVSVIPPRGLISAITAQAIEPGRQVYLSGTVQEGIVRRAAIQKLNIDDQGFSITDEPIVRGSCDYNPQVEIIEASAVSRSGFGVAFSSGLHVFVRLPQTGQWYCAPAFPETYAVGATEGRITDYQEVAVVGDSFTLVAKGDRSNRAEAVFFALDPTGLQAPGDVQGWAPALDVDTYRSSSNAFSLSPVVGASTTLRTVLFGSRVVDLEDGQALRNRSITSIPGWSGVEHAPLAYYSTRSGWEVFKTNDMAIYRRAPEGGEAQQVYGAHRTIDSVGLSLAPWPDAESVVVFKPGAPPRVIEEDAGMAGCARFSPREIEMEPPIAQSERHNTSTHLGEGRYLLTGTSSVGAFFFRWVDIRAARLEAELIAPELKGRYVSSAALLNDGMLIFTEDNDQIWGLMDPARSTDHQASDLVRLESVWDDPSTAEEEGPIDYSGTFFGYRDLTVSHGVAWASGKNLLTRVVPGAAGTMPRVEAYWRHRADRSAFADVIPFQGATPGIYRVKATCPDRVAFSTDWHNQNTLTGDGIFRIGAWRITDGDQCGSPSPDVLSMCGHPVFQAGSSMLGTHGGGITGIHFTDRGLYHTMWDGYLLSSEGYLPINDNAAHALPDAKGRLWFAADRNERAGVIVFPNQAE